MLRSSLLTLAFVTLTAIPAVAQTLVGNDTAPGDSCTDKPAGATRVTADADQDGKEITLICDGTIWQAEANDIQDGFKRSAVENDPCTMIGQMAQSSSGDLLVCMNAGDDISGESCSGFNVGAISLDSDGSIHGCMNLSGPCGGSPTPGTTCNDGSIYAGLSPDGNMPMYTTATDASSFYTWNDGNGNYSTTGATSLTTGEGNTATLVSTDSDDLTNGFQPHDAAVYCDGLSAHGHGDWYLPAQDELNVLYTNKNAGDLNGTFDETANGTTGWYWSSTEVTTENAREQRFSDGTTLSVQKRQGHSVRCVRR